MGNKIILDVDTGVDDALAILLAVRSEALEVLGITTVNGNVSLEQATVNTCKILQLAGCERDIPVVPGADQPLLRHSYFEHRVHGKDGLGGALREMDVRKKPEQSHAVDFIIDQVSRRPGEVTLVMTAPLTNLALAVRKYPDLVREVCEVIVMGGAAQTYGNVTPTAEYNIYVDPEAARIVFHAGFPRLTMVGLDVTRKALLTDGHIARIGDGPLGRYVKESTADYMARYYERNDVRACAMHDPLALSLAINKELVSTRHLYVDVETKSELCDGQTVCDFQSRLSRPANVHVCLDVDADAFLELFVDTLRT